MSKQISLEVLRTFTCDPLVRTGEINDLIRDESFVYATDGRILLRVPAEGFSKPDFEAIPRAVINVAKVTEAHLAGTEGLDWNEIPTVTDFRHVVSLGENLFNPEYVRAVQSRLDGPIKWCSIKDSAVFAFAQGIGVLMGMADKNGTLRDEQDFHTSLVVPVTDESRRAAIDEFFRCMRSDPDFSSSNDGTPLWHSMIRARARLESKTVFQVRNELNRVG